MTKDQVKNIVNALSPETEIIYIEIFDKHEYSHIKEEWQKSDVSVHLKIKTHSNEGSMTSYELESTLDKYTGIDWMVDIS